MSLPTPFQSCGATFAANATTSSGTVTLNWSQPAAYFSITNIGTSPVYYRISTNTIASVAIPAPGASAPGQMINAGDSQIVMIPSVDANGSNLFVTQANVAVITPTGSSLVYVQPVNTNW
jgi:hypothetical protein